MDSDKGKKRKRSKSSDSRPRSLDAAANGTVKKAKKGGKMEASKEAPKGSPRLSPKVKNLGKDSKKSPTTANASPNGSSPDKKGRKKHKGNKKPAGNTPQEPGKRPGVGDSNWSKIQSLVAKESNEKKKRPATEHGGGPEKKSKRDTDSSQHGIKKPEAQSSKDKPLKRLVTPAVDVSEKSLTKYLAVDCEMVGCGPDGKRSALARVCVVNFHGQVLYDKFVKPQERVTDYRTAVSGITPKLLVNAEPFKKVVKEVFNMFNNRILVGHSIENDLKALILTHPKKDIRDTARFKPLKGPGGRPQKLKTLAKNHLGVVIQEGEHSPAEDAAATMAVYKKFQKEWEASLNKKFAHHKTMVKNRLMKQQNKQKAIKEQNSKLVKGRA